MYFTDNDAESELILPRGSTFDIISAKNDDGLIVIEMNYKGD